MLQRFRPNTGRPSVDRLFENFFGEFTNPSSSFWTHDPLDTKSVGSFPIVLKEEDDRLVVHADLPGIDAKHLSVEVENDILKIQANVEESADVEESEHYYYKERRISSMRRVVSLPHAVDVDNTTSVYKDGVLEIVLPKMEKSKAKQIIIASQ